jgi:hypothetical protein
MFVPAGAIQHSENKHRHVHLGYCHFANCVGLLSQKRSTMFIPSVRYAVQTQSTRPWMQGWTERDIFGKIRFMNYNGCKRKFSIPDYITSVDKRIREEKKAAESAFK